MITVTTHTGWFSRLGSSIVGVLFGLLLLVGGVWALSWNEGRAVNTQRSLEEGEGVVVTVPADAVNPANEGKLIHTTGELVVAEPLRDPDFAIEAAGVRLTRTAEMFQWVETTKKETRTKLGGGEETVTVYDYRQEWQDDAVDSTQFREQAGRHNPPMPVEDTTISAPGGALGAFAVGENVMAEMG
ncbi:MAG TPA: TMEM43 family protein, partial [Reyranella sp.]|nr:TMEM43 family protein [Reyranella sp.]